jgi:SAM-dependent methyltransferase
MGVNFGNLVLLKAYADARGGPSPLGDLVMYGRLHSTLSKPEKAKFVRRFGVGAAALEGHYTEPLLKDAGAKTVMSVDVSDYEKCDFVIDLMEDIAQRPDLAEKLCGRFDTVLDYGTSEHVFNFPQALVNAWNMLREDGRYVFDLPIAGWVNHGLVQYTPSYFYSVGRTPYFELEYIFFHGKHGRFVDLAEFDSKYTRRVHLGGKTSAWGVFRKRRPPELAGPLTLKALRVMQHELHEKAKEKNRTYSIDTIAEGFRNWRQITRQ